MAKSSKIIVAASEAGERLDRVLANNMPERSRSEIEAQIKLGNTSLNQKATTKPAQKVQENDEIEIEFIAAKKEPIAEPDLEIIYEDDDCIVINKPASLVVYPPDGRNQPSVVGALRDKIADPDPVRPGVVHRLDKDTSGVLILAKTAEAKEYLMNLFKTRQVEKTYEALVDGVIEPSKARVELPVEHDYGKGTKMRVAADGKPSTLEYNTIEAYPNNSLLTIKLLTGRTHQIRVQLKYLGHPVVGDNLYGKRTRPNGLSRQFLHARELRLILPNGQTKTFSSELAPELKKYLLSL